MRPGFWQILVVVVLIAVLFGGKKIPELARAFGKAKGEFKKGLAEGNAEEKEAAAKKDEEAKA
ncbi:MAG: twin-arginine translocase TatA/TatE family subunit [Kiritimatiellae bacterium]|nr:twin-arginine translocase TatA/TatE family subunit [Kiritimatiellia bacterium]